MSQCNLFHDRSSFKNTWSKFGAVLLIDLCHRQSVSEDFCVDISKPDVMCIVVGCILLLCIAGEAV